MGEVLALEPAEISMWEEHFKTCPPEHFVVPQLLARLGVIVESFLHGEVDPKHWFFWHRDPPKKAIQDLSELSEQDLDLGRQAMLAQMGEQELN